MMPRFHPPYISPSDTGTACFKATRRSLGYLEHSLGNEKMVVKVYGKAQAVCPQRVMHCLMEKGVPFELVHVDIDTMEHKRPEFLQKQPFGQVPYIVDGDLELFESRAIVRYLAAKYADRGPNLLGRTPEERAKVEQWLDVEAINYNPWAFPIVFNLFVLPIRGLPANEAEAGAAVDKLNKVLEVYEKQLSKTKYLAGDEFTLADLTHIPATRYIVENCGLSHLLDDKKHVKAWWEDITGRPAWKKLSSFVETGGSNFSP
ncbi:Glutathione S-transferase [Musa troglodytarum]|uniref:glutathione transferase n=1 Tax=Musa troglodytarum TaxID=320322 RepID=A0A9E7FHY4_9LILI|nr:Glutathione S-transferase [Musa troglodytarum]